MNNDDQVPFAKVSETKAAETQDDGLINRVVVTKVFSSLSRPCMAELKRFTEGTDVDTEDLQTTVYPTLLIKKGKYTPQQLLSISQLRTSFNVHDTDKKTNQSYISNLCDSDKTQKNR